MKLDAITGIHTVKGWTGIALATIIAVILIPCMNLLAPAGSLFYLPDYLIPLLGKFLCFGIIAIAMDLAWGYCGILSLGHGVFFSLGGYAMGMHLMRVMAGEGVYRSDLPDFMVFLDWQELPWYWYGFDNFGFALAIVVLAPALLAFVFGFLAFRSKIKGVYFSIITQAMTYALMLLFFRNETGFGGNNGLTDFKRILGFSLLEQHTKVGLYAVTALTLLSSYLLCRFIVRSKLGRVLTAIRDAEDKVTFTGFDPISYKLFAWVVSATLCGVAGALYVPQVGIINPSEMAPANSIEMAIWVAVGGRGTLVGAILGAGVVNGLKSWCTVAFPEAWLYVLGTLFILVTLFFPGGVISLLGRITKMLRRNDHQTSPIPEASESEWADELSGTQEGRSR